MMRGVQASAPFRSADGLTLYVTLGTGACRRVKYDGPELVFVRRIGKAAMKAEKRARHTRA